MGIQLSHLKWLIPVLAVVILFSLISWNPESHPDLPDKVDFNYHVRPILTNNCFACHGPDESTREAGLRLDNYDDATATLEEGGRAIVPGKPSKSRLIQRINHSDLEMRMPPESSKKSLTSYQKALLEKWIDQGAEYRPHWAFIQPTPPNLPGSLHGASASDVIDHLIEEEINEHGLITVSETRPESLIRRLSYILTGLPPKPEDVLDFVDNYNDQKYIEYVNRYLNSPHYGERWARHWMDVIRYSESQGHEEDSILGGAWHYRDYLIRAFNDDLPYDQMVLEHLAGDLLQEPRYGKESEVNESVLATASICMGEAKSFPVDVKQEEAERINTMIDVTTTAFQALTVACARCHDHKFDPIPTKDYYALYGIFEGTRITTRSASLTRSQVLSLDSLELHKEQLYAWLDEKIPQNSQTKSYTYKEDSETKRNNSIHFIGDFRDGSWSPWSTESWAFGSSPVYNEPILDRKKEQLEWVNSGYASSRKLTTGLGGNLRSPNFFIERDSMLIRARGINGTIRLIVENYQPISQTLYGGLEIFVKVEEWKDYTINLSFIKGRKAYLEFLPGILHMQTLTQEKDDYIEVAYAITYNGDTPEILSPKNTVMSSGKMPKSQLNRLVVEYDEHVQNFYDSTKFTGLAMGEPVFSPVFDRGDFKSLGQDEIPHGFLSAIDTGQDDFPQDGRGRLAWAQSVIDPGNPLTSRIMVNRLWHYVFGRGLVETVDNFGVQGKLPSHPELLDYLALQFMNDGWSIKTAIRHMILSQTFRRATNPETHNIEADAQNIYLAHYPVRRLESEALRDGVLAVSGRLDPTFYGTPVPVDYTPFLTAFEKDVLPTGVPKEFGPMDGDGRRSVYQMVRRSFINPLMITFDTPIPSATVGQRNVSYTPAQSLTLLNDPFFHEQASVWAGDIISSEWETVEDIILEIYLRAFSRHPSEVELEDALEFLTSQAHENEDMKSDQKLWADYCHSIMNMKEFIHLL